MDIALLHSLDAFLSVLAAKHFFKLCPSSTPPPQKCLHQCLRDWQSFSSWHCTAGICSLININYNIRYKRGGKGSGMSLVVVLDKRTRAQLVRGSVLAS